MNRLRLAVAISAMTLAVVAGERPGAAQLVVFDPNNYAQNVLTAARALQQINNQIVSLQNQAQMLINQAKNLATLPFSSFSFAMICARATKGFGAAPPYIPECRSVRAPRTSISV